MTYFGKVSGFIANGDQVKLELKDKSGAVISSFYVTPDASGNWSWNDSANTRADGNYTLVASIVDKAGNAVNTNTASQIITVDTQSSQNTDPSSPSNVPSEDPNKVALVSIASIDDGLTGMDKATGSKDTGSSSSDFYSGDNTLTYFGKVSGFTANGDQVKLELKDKSGAVISSAYVTPDASGNWSWNDSANTRADGNYTLVASIVDKAGNTVSVNTASQIITVDTKSDQNTDPSSPSNVPSDDPNKVASVSIASIDDGLTATVNATGSKDTGASSGDFYTGDNTLTYFGKVSGFTANGDQVKLELKDKSGAVISSAYVTPDASGNWSWNDSANTRADGNYTLVASIVDKAGNAVSVSASQVVTIDTSPSQNSDPSNPGNAPAQDSNVSLNLNIEKMSSDTANTTMSGTDKDWITSNKNPIFSGSFGSFAFDSSNDNITFQLLSSDGKLIKDSSSILLSDKKSWSTAAELTGSGLDDGVYYSRVLITDKAGNVVSTDTQKFLIDTKIDFAEAGNKYDINGNISVFTFVMKESVAYEFYSINANKQYVKINGFDGVYQGGPFEITTQQAYGKDGFAVKITDASGNVNFYYNAYQNNDSVVNQKIIFSADPAFTTVNTIKAGSMATYAISENTPFDLSKLVDTSPKPGDSLIHNEISMTGNGVQQLSLHLNDVLSLGAVNSFDTSPSYAGDVQMRIKGDSQNGAQDKVTLLDSSVWTNTKTTVTLDDNIQYQVFTANNGTVDLFIQSNLQIYKSDLTFFV